jgi:hypothetical protein
MTVLPVGASIYLLSTDASNAVSAGLFTGSFTVSPGHLDGLTGVNLHLVE